LKSILVTYLCVVQAGAFVSNVCRSRAKPSVKLHSGNLAGSEVLNLPVTSMKPSLRTFLHFFLIGEYSSDWRADSGDFKNIVVRGAKGGGFDLVMDESAKPTVIRATRLEESDDDEGLLAQERALLLALVDEIGNLASDSAIPANDRLVQVDTDAFSVARNALLGPEGRGGSVKEAEAASEKEEQYVKAKKLLAKKAKFEKGRELKRKVEKENSGPGL